MEYLVIDDLNEKVLPAFSIVFFTLAVCCIVMPAIHWVLGVLFFSMSVVAFMINKQYKFTRDFQNEIQFVFLESKLWTRKLNLKYPDYISVFHASFKSEDDEGNIDRFKKWTIRFFKDNRYETIFEEDEYEEALQKARAIGDFFDIEVYDASKG